MHFARGERSHLQQPSYGTLTLLLLMAEILHDVVLQNLRNHGRHAWGRAGFISSANALLTHGLRVRSVSTKAPAGT